MESLHEILVDIIHAFAVYYFMSNGLQLRINRTHTQCVSMGAQKYRCEGNVLNINRITYVFDGRRRRRRQRMWNILVYVYHILLRRSIMCKV